MLKKVTCFFLLISSFSSISKGSTGYDKIAKQYFTRSVMYQAAINVCLKDIPKLTQKLVDEFNAWEKQYLDIIKDGYKKYEMVRREKLEQGEYYESVDSLLNMFEIAVSAGGIGLEDKYFIHLSKKEKNNYCQNIYENIILQIEAE